jgi:hypothetical protein
MAPSSDKPMRAQIEEYVFALQDRIVAALEAVDPNALQFKRDSWVRGQGGQGRSCVFATPSQSPAAATLAEDAGALVLEKAGVNISIVHGTLPPAAVARERIPVDPARATGLPFYAAGLSLVVHPRNPQRTDGAHERPLLRDLRRRAGGRRRAACACVMVRRRRRPHAVVPVQGRRGTLPRSATCVPRTALACTQRSRSGATRTSTSRTTARRAA